MAEASGDFSTTDLRDLPVPTAARHSPRFEKLGEVAAAAVIAATYEGVEIFRRVLADAPSLRAFMNAPESGVFLERLRNSGFPGDVLADSALARRESLKEVSGPPAVDTPALFDAVSGVLPYEALRACKDITQRAPARWAFFVQDDPHQAFRLLHCLVNTSWEGKVTAERALGAWRVVESLVPAVGREATERLIARFDPVTQEALTARASSPAAAFSGVAAALASSDDRNDFVINILPHPERVRDYMARQPGLALAVLDGLAQSGPPGRAAVATALHEATRVSDLVEALGPEPVVDLIARLRSDAQAEILSQPMMMYYLLAGVRKFEDRENPISRQNAADKIMSMIEGQDDVVQAKILSQPGALDSLLHYGMLARVTHMMEKMSPEGWQHLDLTPSAMKSFQISCAVRNASSVPPRAPA